MEKSGIEGVVIRLRGRRKEIEDEDEETNCHPHVVSTGGGFPLSSNTYLSGPLGQHKTVMQGGAKTSVKK